MKNKIIFFTPAGEKFTNTKAKEYVEATKNIIFICGRYEGIDARVEQYLIHESLSIGQFVLTGGELPALTMLDAISRHIPDVLGNEESLSEESWTYTDTKEYPQYSRPAEFTPDNPHLIVKDAPHTWTVPDILLSGNHQLIHEWKQNQKK